MNRYLTNLEMIPTEHRDLFKKINGVIENAFADPGKIKRVFAGWYYVVIDDELIKIDQCDEGENFGEWYFSEENGSWYGDPLPTLRDVKRALEI